MLAAGTKLLRAEPTFVELGVLAPQAGVRIVSNAEQISKAVGFFMIRLRFNNPRPLSNLHQISTNNNLPFKILMHSFSPLFVGDSWIIARHKMS